jgi:hypothetical protein
MVRKFYKLLVINRGLKLKSADISQSEKMSNEILLQQDQELIKENVSVEGVFI